MSDTSDKRTAAKLGNNPGGVPSVDNHMDIADNYEELLDGLPADKKELVQKLVIQESFGMMGIGRLASENEVAKKINETHITNYLDGAREQMRNDYKERHEKKIFAAILVLFALAFLIIVIVLLKDNPDVLEKVIYPVVTLVAGALGGYGYGRHKNNED